MKTPPLQLSISSEKGGARYLPFLKKYVPLAHVAMRSSLRDLSLFIAGDRTMSALHKRYMNIAGPTDVLTFELERSRGRKIVGGEIVICLGEAGRQARALDIPISHELLLYAIHGMLHLDRFDDLTIGGAKKMHAEEDRILTEIGIGPVFVRDARRH